MVESVTECLRPSGHCLVLLLKHTQKTSGEKMILNKSSPLNTPEVPVFTRVALERALSVGGCIICTAVRASERKSIHSFLYEGMMSPGVRQDFLRKGGFCSRHFWLAKEIEEDSWQAGGIGLAILCEDLLRLASATFEKHIDPSRQKKRTIALPTAPTKATIGAPCIFCEENATRESYLIEVLEELLEEPPFRRPFGDDRLCVTHGQIAVTNWKIEGNRRWIASAVHRRTVVLAEEVRKFIDKHDYQRKGELAVKDDDAVQRAMRMLVGSDRRSSQDEAARQ